MPVKKNNLTEAEAYKMIFNSVDSGVVIYHSVDKNANDFIFVDFNKAVEKIEKIKRKDLLGRNLLEIFPGVKELGLFDVMQKVFQDGKTRNHPIKFYKDKRIQGWRENNIQRLANGDLLVIYKDLSETKKQEKELKEKNKSLYAVLDNAPFGIYIINKNGRLDYVNRAMLNISSAKRDRFIKINFFNHINYKKHGIVPKIKKVFKGETFSLKNIKYKSSVGKKTTIRNFTGVPIYEGEERKALIFVEDITEIKNKEKEATEAVSEWLETFNAMSDGVSIHAPDFTILNANKSVCKILGKTREEIIGKKCFKLFHNTKNPIAECPLKKSLQTKKKEYMEIFEKELGIWISVSVSPVVKDGRIIKFIHAIRSINEKKEAEMEIIKSQERLNNILHSISVGVVIIDALKHEIIDINGVAAGMIGLPPKKIIGSICHNFICPARKGACPISDLKQNMDHSEKILVDKNGKQIPIYKTVAKTTLDGVEVFIESFVDISEQKEANKLLLEKNKELEKFNKFVIDRELKMIELKNKIKKLEQKND